MGLGVVDKSRVFQSQGWVTILVGEQLWQPVRWVKEQTLQGTTSQLYSVDLEQSTSLAMARLLMSFAR